MHADGLDGLHELVREAARPHWVRGDLAAAVHAAWAAVWQALPPGDVLFVDPASPDADSVQTGIDELLRSMARLNGAAETLADDAPQAALELLASLSLCARYVGQAVSADVIDRVLAACRAVAPTGGAAQVERIVADVPGPARAMVTAHLVEALTQPGGPALPGTRAVYLRLVEAHATCAITAAARCTELLRDTTARRRAVAALSPSVLDRLDPGDRVVIPAVLALELQDGWLEGEHVVRGWAGADAASLLWDDFLPTARAQIVEAIGFGLQNGEPELQAYLARVVCSLAPLLVGRESGDLTRGLARALVRRNAVDAADQVVAAAAALPPGFCAALLDAIAVQQPTGPQDAAAAVRAALGDAQPAAQAS